MKIFFFTLIAAAALILSGCSHLYEVRSYAPPARSISTNDAVYIVIPHDGPKEPGSGRIAAQTLANSFARHARRVKIADEFAPLDQHLTNALAAGCQLVLVTDLQKWKEEATEWSGLSDELTAKLTLLDVTGARLSETLVHGESKVGTWGGDRVEHLLAGIGGKWIDTLYGRSTFGTTKPIPKPTNWSKR